MQNEVVFIVGCARTGSTLLRDILNRSDQICLTTETHYLRRMSSVGLWKRIKNFGDLQDDRNAEQLVAYWYAAYDRGERNYWSWLRKHVDQQHFTQRLLATDRSERAIFTMLMQVYAETKCGAITPNMVLGEKTPTHLYYVPTLLEWYPQAKIIHTFRDPRGIFVSTLKRMQSGKWGFKNKLPSVPARLLNPFDIPSAMLHTTKGWLDAVRLHAAYKQMYGAQYHLVRFEDLVVNPQEHVRQVCSFLNVPFDATMVADTRVISSSYHDQRRGASGFDAHAVNRWQEHINPLIRAWFAILGRKYLKTFGYLP